MASVYKPNEKETGKPKKGAKWRMRFKDERGRWKDLSSGTTCKQTALAEANRRESEAIKIKTGVMASPEQRSKDKKAFRPLQSHVEDYRVRMENAGVTPKHIAEQISILESFMDQEGVIVASEADPVRIGQYVNSLVQKNKSNRTVQKHITALRTFFTYLVELEIILKDPTKGIKKPSPAKDRRHKRRMLTREEWAWLASTTQKEKTRWNMTGKARWLLYWTAIETGYRSNELRQIRRSNLSKLNGRHFITLDSDVTKNGNSAKQYVSSELASELLQHVRTLRPNDPMFSMPAAANVARMLKKDLESAKSSWSNEENISEKARDQRIESDFLKYENEGKQKLDFHALRHTCGAWLIIAGVDVKTVQTILRHSTPTLTLNTYGHLLEGAESNAVTALDAQAQQIHSKLAAREGNPFATCCEEAKESSKATNEKSPGKTRGFASDCTPIPLSAIAPPVGLEPTTNGLTVRRSTN